MEETKKGLKQEARNWIVSIVLIFIIYIIGWVMISIARWFISWVG